MKELRDIISAENKERSTFLKAYGEVIPLDFIPQLKILPSKIPSLEQILNPDESNLPLICDWVPLDSIQTSRDYYMYQQLLKQEELDSIP